MSLSQPTKPKFLDTVADENGVAVVVLDGEGREVSSSNNNSICRLLYNSDTSGSKCAEFCGSAFQRTTTAGEVVSYECHAGLQCSAVQVEDRGKRFVAIVGRTFTRSVRYREATEKAISGDWRLFPPTEFFGNVLFSGSTEPIDKAVKKLERFAPQAHEEEPLDLSREHVPIHEANAGEITSSRGPELSEPPQAAAINDLIEKFNREASRKKQPEPSLRRPNRDPEEISAMRSLMSMLMRMNYDEACHAVLKHISKFFGGGSAVWLELREGIFESVAGIGELKKKHVRVDMQGSPLSDDADPEKIFELNEKTIPGQDRKPRSLVFFPIIVGGEIRAAIGVHENDEHPIDRSSIARVARAVGPKMEILRLRQIVHVRDQLAQNLKQFNESLSRIDSSDFWNQVTRVSAELLGAERASILVKDDDTGSLSARASIGAPVDIARVDDLGVRIAKRALEGRQPLVVPDVDLSRFGRAPEERRYRTGSFLSFPISIGDRDLAVMNFTDRVGGEAFGEHDVELLRTIAPQLAVALDRKALKIKAGELEKRSITDSLTGLMNRGYIEERLVEEMNRASRHRFQMCLLMIDVDNFKQYNDTYGHPAGDTALMLVATVLKDTLRAADVAARYGGEEFAVLLPQTAAEEGRAIAERLRQRIERTEFPKRRVTISIGLAAYSNEFAEPKDWITAADMALYEAKGLGRNTVQIYEDLGRSFKEKIH